MEDLKQIMPKKLGFGCMRLPVANGNSEEIDDAVFCRMIDHYMEQGFVYFDTAYPYHNQKSEEAVRRCLVERYDRDASFSQTRCRCGWYRTWRTTARSLRGSWRAAA